MAPRTVTVARKPGVQDAPVKGDEMVLKLFEKLCIDSNTPLAFSAYHKCRNGDFDALTGLKFDPFFYEWNGRHAELELDYQIVSFFKKYQGFTLRYDKETLAYDKWLKTEESCKKVNDIFRSRWEGISHFPFRVEEVYHLFRRKISEILGTIGPNDLDFIRDHAHHGPGADTKVRRSNASAYLKYQTPGAITPACVTLFDDIFNREDSDLRCDFAHQALIEHDSRLSFVPKTARIDRAICVEPRWNIYLQLGIGSLIAKRLRRYGQDIQSQSRNQEAARRAHVDGLATVDLTSASDSIATNLVVDMLDTGDPYWYDLLLKSRCHSTKYRQRTIRLEKISSMGNGYTFPLETLIFYALAWAACKQETCNTRQIQVYGDDIIVPRKAYSLLVETLECLGFSVNTEKSYASGSFYESCGCDFYLGREVRPFFVKERVRTILNAYELHNQVIEWAGRNQVLPGLLNYRRWRLARSCVYEDLPKYARLCGPIGLDGVLHADFAEWSLRGLRAREFAGQEGVYIKRLVTTAVTVNRYGIGLLYPKLQADVNSRHRVVLLGREKTTVKRTLVPWIPDFVLDEDRGLESCAFSC